MSHGISQLGRIRGGHPVVAQAIERLAPRRRRQPRAGAVRCAAAVPVDRRGDERVLHDVLRQGEVAVKPARDGGQHGGALVAVRPLERARRGAHANEAPTIGRMSTEPYSAAGVFAATAIAASRSATSRM